MTRVVALLVVVGAGVAVALPVWNWSTRGADRPPHVSDALVVPPGSRDFGEVWESDRFLWTFPVSNPGPVALVVSRVSTSCNCAQATPLSFRLNPGQTQDVTLVMNLYKRADGRDSFTAAVEFEYASDGVEQPVKTERVEISGRVRRGLVVQRECHLGRFSDLATEYGTTVVPVRSPLALKTLTVDTPDPGVRARLLDRAADGAYQVEVGLSGRLPRGPYEGRLVLTAVSEAGLVVPAVTVPVSVDIVDDIQAEPAELVTGGRVIGESYESSFSIRSLVGNGFRVESVTADGPGLEVTRWEPTEPDIRLRRRVVAVGQQTAHVRAVVRSGDRVSTVVVPVTCFGVESSDR